MYGRVSDLSRIVANVPLMIGMLGLLLIVLLALAGERLAPHDPFVQRLVVFYEGGRFTTPPAPPSERFPLGTDILGRDLFSRVLAGARLTLTLALVALLIRTVLGVGLGLLAGWRGGLTDRAATAAASVLAGVPQFALALILALALAPYGVVGFAIAVAAVGWPELMQSVRREVLHLRRAPWVEAAVGLGAQSGHVVSQHVVPVLAPQLVVLLTLQAGAVLLLLAELGFVGMFIAGGVAYYGGEPVRDHTPEWGQMLAGARAYRLEDQWVVAVPALVLVGVIAVLNLFGQGLRAASSPHSPLRLGPTTMHLLSRALLASILIGAAAGAFVAFRSIEIDFAEGLERAHAAAEKVEPGYRLVAGVVRLDAADLVRPAKLNYYFRSPNRRLLRVGFAGADANAAETRPFHDEDGIHDLQLMPLGEWSVEWEAALAHAETLGGSEFREGYPATLTRVWLMQAHGWSHPVYLIEYSAASVEGRRFLRIPVNALDVTAPIEFSLVPTETLIGRARIAAFPRLERGVITAIRARYVSEPGLRNELWGEDGPAGVLFSPPTPAEVTMRFGDGVQSVDVHFDLRAGFFLVPSGLDPLVLPELSESIPVEPSVQLPTVDLAQAFLRLEEAGGREMREQWKAQGHGEWVADMVILVEEARLVAQITYAAGPLERQLRLELDSD